MALQELLLSSSNALTCLHDLRTGSLVTSFKSSSSSGSSSSDQNFLDASTNSNAKGKGKAIDNNSKESTSVQYRKIASFVQSKNGQGGLVVSTVPGGKAALNVWSFQREAPLHRLLLPVKLACLALSKSGVYLAGGAADGRLLLWELSTGNLLASFDAHYRCITCLSWTDDDAGLISGSDDSACHVWSLASMISSSNNPLLPVTPYLSLSDHTLPITDLCIGFGKYPNCRVLTASLDGSVKIWDLTVPGLPLLSTFGFPSPLQVTQVALDPLERHFFAATYNPATQVSSVHKVDLYQRTRNGEPDEEVDGNDDEEEEADEQEENGTSRKGKPGSYEALGGGGRGDMERVEIGDGEINRPGKLYLLPSSTSSSGRITSLSLSSLSSTLLIGTSSGTIQILSLPSLQPIRTINPSISTSTGSSLAHPITFLGTLIRPIDLISRTGAGASAGTPNGSSANSQKEEQVQPRWVNSQLSRSLIQPGSKEAEEKVVNIRLGKQDDVSDLVVPPFSNDTFSATSLAFHSDNLVGPSSSDISSQSLQEENARLKEQLARSIAMNEKMWEGLVDNTLAKAKSQSQSQGDVQMANGRN